MTPLRPSLWAAVAAASTAVGLSAPAQAGCPCEAGVSFAASSEFLAPMPADEFAPVPQVTPVAPPSVVGTPVAPPSSPAAALQAVVPPPGTLGQTYSRPSALIPKDEHPRTAMIEVRVTGYSHVEVLGLEDFEGFLGDDGLWHFKSKRPLLPDTPHVYQVIAHNGTPAGTEVVRTVRMIPGRVVRLDF